MTPIEASAARLIEIARRLRDIASRQGDVELKSQILDEISALQELRESVSASEPASSAAPAEWQPETGSHPVPAPSRTASPTVAASSSMPVIKPSDNGETYGLHHEEDEDEHNDEDTVFEIGLHREEPEIEEGDTEEMGDVQRALLAELRIAELQPMLDAATHRLNDVFTPDQRRIKKQATKTGKAEGRSGKELQQYVYAAMKLTNEQKTHIIAARKDVQSLRAAIDRELSKLSDEQRARFEGRDNES